MKHCFCVVDFLDLGTQKNEFRDEENPWRLQNLKFEVEVHKYPSLFWRQFRARFISDLATCFIFPTQMGVP